eukprot:gene9844-10889_t
MEISVDALDRILKRLQDVRKEDLPSVLSSLLPRVLPLANDATLREKVVAIVGEAMKRVKMHECSLSLSVFRHLIGPSQLPFCCNFALAFLDLLEGSGRLTEVLPETLPHFIRGAYQHKAFSHQSNALLLYAVKYSAVLESAFVSSSEEEKDLMDFIGDYYIDVCLATVEVFLPQPPASSWAGLSDVRKERLASQKKILFSAPQQTLSHYRKDLLSLTFLPKEYLLAMRTICSVDSDSEVVSKTAFVANKAKSTKGTSLDERVLSLLSSLFFGLVDEDLCMLRKRTPFLAKHRQAFLQLLLNDVVDSSQVTFLDISIRIFEKLQSESVNTLNNSDVEGKQLQSLCLLLSKILPAISSQAEIAKVTKLLSMLKVFLGKWQLSSAYTEGGQGGFAVRGACYDLVNASAAVFPDQIGGDRDLVQRLLALVQVEASFPSLTNLLSALGKINLIFKENYSGGVLQCPRFEELRQQSKASCRVIYLQWLRFVRPNPADVLCRLALSADDTVDIVNNCATALFSEFCVTLKHQLEKSGETGSSMQAYLFTLLDAFLSSADQENSIRSFSTESSSRSSLLLLGALSEATDVVVRASTDSLVRCDEQSLEQLQTVLPRVVDALVHSLDIASERLADMLETKNLHLYVDERLVASEVVLEAKSSAGVELASKIIWNAIQMGSSSAREAILQKCHFALLNKWLLIPYKRVRDLICQSLSFLWLNCVNNSNSGSTVSSYIHNLEETLQGVTYQQMGHELLMSASSFNLAAQFLMLSSNSSLAKSLLDSISRVLLSQQSVSDIPSHSVAQRILKIEAVCALGRLIASTADQVSVHKLYTALSDCLSGSLLGSEEPLYIQAHLQLTIRLAISQQVREEEAVAFIERVVKCPRPSRSVLFTCAEGLFLLENISSMTMAQKEQLLRVLCWNDLLEKAASMENYSSLVSAIDRIEARAGDMAFSSIQLLVYTKWLGSCSGFLPFEFFEKTMRLLLNSLREKDGFLQDVSCMGLCRLHHLAKISRCIFPVNLSEKYESLVDYLSSEIVLVITRQTRYTQPLGYDVSGRGQNTEPQQGQEPEEPDGEMVDELLAAVNEAATSELSAALNGVIVQQLQQRQAQPQTEIPEQASYGVYRKVCEIAKKSKESGVIMMVLAQLIRSDPTPPVVSIQASRLVPLIPMLFVAKNDPVVAVRQVMREVWEQLLANPLKQAEGGVLRDNFPSILPYLIDNMLNPRWREREAVCICLETILTRGSDGGQHWDPLLTKHLPLLLRKGFRVMDDLRESTRKAAASFMKTLLNQMLMACENVDVVEASLPLLLDEGLTAPCLEARGFSLGALLKLVQRVPSLLRPWLEKVIDVLLEAASAMEPQMLVYMQFHVGNTANGVSEVDWEQKRLQLSQSSPVLEALRACLVALPADLLPATCSVLIRHLRGGVGLPTRAAAADAFSFLVEKFPVEMARIGPEALQLLRLTLSARPGMSFALRKTIIQAIGMLAKVTQEEALEDEVRQLIECYETCSASFSSSLQEKDLPRVMAAALQEIIKKAGDRLKDSDLISLLLSTAFVGSEEIEEEVREQWSQTFSAVLETTGVGSKVMAIRRAVVPITRHAALLLLSLSWERRRQATGIVRELLANMAWPLLAPNMGRVLAALWSTMRCNAWQGQEEVLECLSLILAKAGNVTGEECGASAANQFSYNLDSPPIALLLNSDSLPRPLRLEISETGDALFQSSSLQEELRALFQANRDPNFLCTTDWTMNPRAFLLYFAHELSRKEADYRLAAARAMVAVPWTLFRSTIPAACRAIVPILIQLAQLRARPRITQEDSDEMLSSSARRPRIVVKEKSAANANRGLATAALFGHRYGSSYSAKHLHQSQPTSRSLKRAASDQDSASEPDSANTTTAGEEAGDVDISNVPSSNGGLDNNGKSVSVEESSASYAGRRGSMDPVYRMHLIDALTGAWVSLEGNMEQEQEKQLMKDLISWAMDSMREEVWSVRRATLHLLGAIGGRTLLPADLIAGLLDCIQLALQEPKFAKVKIAAFNALESCLQGESAKEVLALQGERVRTFARNGVLDSQAQVLEVAARLQQLLLRL